MTIVGKYLDVDGKGCCQVLAVSLITGASGHTPGHMLLLATDRGELFDRCVGVLGMRITVPVAAPRTPLSGADTWRVEWPKTEVSSSRAEETATDEDRGSDAAASQPADRGFSRIVENPEFQALVGNAISGSLNDKGPTAKDFLPAESGVRCEGCGKPGTSMCKGCRDSCPCPGCVKRRADDSSAPVVSDRVQGVDCSMCEANVPHTHVPTATRTDVTNPPPMRFADILKSPGFRKMMDVETDRALRDCMASAAMLAGFGDDLVLPKVQWVETPKAWRCESRFNQSGTILECRLPPAHGGDHKWEDGMLTITWDAGRQEPPRLAMTSDLAHDIQNARLVLGWNHGESLTDAANRAQQRTAEARQQRDVAIAFADSIEVAKAARDRAEIEVDRVAFLGPCPGGVCSSTGSSDVVPCAREKGHTGFCLTSAEIARLKAAGMMTPGGAAVPGVPTVVQLERDCERLRSANLTATERIAQLEAEVTKLRESQTTNVTNIVCGPDKAWEQTAKALRAEVDALTKDLAETAAKLIDARRQALEARTLLTDLRKALG